MTIRRHTIFTRPPKTTGSGTNHNLQTPRRWRRDSPAKKHTTTTTNSEKRHTLHKNTHRCRVEKNTYKRKIKVKRKLQDSRVRWREKQDKKMCCGGATEQATANEPPAPPRP